jgi:D-lyxose ketol-isomerase
MDEIKMREEALLMLEKSGFPVTEKELATFKLNDFGLGNLSEEGFGFIDLLRTDRVRVTLQILLPYQTLPQHKHPPYENENGKEETIRNLWGQFKVYVEGDADRTDLRIPNGKDAFYTARKEVILEKGGQFTVEANVDHWFQAGPEGAVALAFQNRVDETRNIFYDLGSTGCPIPETKIGSY